MDSRLYLTCLWPGLPQLWWRGRLSALPSAIAFAIALNLLLVARFIYPEWLTYSFVRVLSWLGLVSWCVCTFKNIRELPTILHPRKVSKAPDRFPEARIAYLRTDWVRAEALLQECLAIEERDPPALLMLAAVYRQTSRFESCRVCIEKLRMTEVADRWWLEVDAEERRLQRDLAYHQASNRVSRPTSNQNTLGADIRPTSAAA